MESQYDIILFGVTGFTGKLAVEYLLQKKYPIKWATSARSKAKAETVLKDLCSKFNAETPPILEADLVCETPEQVDTLREIVQQTKVVLTCSGPFEKYSQTLVKLCAELGVYYGDITGETDFFRQVISNHDKKAQETGAVILCHCGNDCIPSDLIVYELYQFAKTKGCELKEVMAYEEFSESISCSGGTAATAAYQLSKQRDKGKQDFDPLVTTPEGTKSKYGLKNISPKSDIDVPTDILDGRKAGPWIMGPIMVNCVKRSNALLGYSKELKYGDAMVRPVSWTTWLKQTAFAVVMGAAIYVPGVFQSLLPKPGEGPDREAMEQGFLKLHALGTMIDNGEKERKLKATFQFNKDTTYLYTAAMLVETGMLLVEKYGALAGGCKTPASALGGDLTERILKELDSSLEVKEI